MASGFVCQKCCKKISGTRYTVDGKNLCYDCYLETITEKEKTEKNKQELYSYIKELFGISEVPLEVISMLDREIAGGKKPSGMKFTLKYYYVIEGNNINVNNIVSLVFVIKDYYESAKKYKEKELALKEKNSKVDLEKKVKTYYVDPADLGNPKRKSKQKIDISKL